MLTLKRIAQGEQGTFGVLIDGQTPLCVTLEDPWKDNQKSISCIPEGIYEVSPHNGRKYKNVWILNDVEDRSAILIHAGNTTDDTRGCILVGQRYGELDGKTAILGSRMALNALRADLPDNFSLEIINA